MEAVGQVCAREGCSNRVLEHTGKGRPGRFCSERCRVAAYRSRGKTALTPTFPASASDVTKIGASAPSVTKISTPAVTKITESRTIISPGMRLAQARARLQLSQEALAEAVGVTSRTVQRWEGDVTIPQPYYRDRLCGTLQMTFDALFRASSAALQAEAFPAPIWYVPFARNPYFTGRADLLQQLRDRLVDEHPVAVIQPQILAGLGGIGKTQIALEYAYRFRSEYQAILWVRAETYETLLADYRTLAQLFQLPEHSSTQHAVVYAAVKRWFQSHTDWLFIFDNVEDLELLQSMLPEASQGHILITTRSQIGGMLDVPLAVPLLDQEESLLLLLRRAKLLPPDAPLEAAPLALRTDATTLVELFDGYPLALDQAGAYVEETSCRLADYLERYATRRRVLLDSRGAVSGHHPASVLATLSLAFQQLEQANPEAADLLRMIAFLHAEAIPEDFLPLAGEVLSPRLEALASDQVKLDAAIGAARRFSLLQRDPATHTLSLHRLVQTMLQERMSSTERALWIRRLIDAFLYIFPSYEAAVQAGGGVQAECQRYLSHALACAALLREAGIASEAAAEFLYRVGYYLHLWGGLVQAIPLMEHALEMAATLPSSNQEQVAFYCNQLAVLYVEVRDELRAEACFRRALAIRERVLGPEHPAVAESLWGLANLLSEQGKYTQAHAFAERALAIKERTLGEMHYEVALVLTILGAITMYQGLEAQAEQMFLRAIRIYEQTLGSRHFFLGSSKMNLSALYYRQARYEQAASLCQQAMELYELHLGPDHHMLASTTRLLGKIYESQQRYPQAEHFLRRSCQIYEKSSIPDLHQRAISLFYFADVSLVQGRLSRAKRCIQQALDLLGERVRVQHPDHQNIVQGLLLIGDQLAAGGNRLQAQTCYRQALTIGARSLGAEHQLTLSCRRRLATVEGET